MFELLSLTNKDGKEVLAIDIKTIKVAEARIVELASATPEKAPELLYFFTEAYGKVSDLIAKTELAYNRAKVDVEKIKAEILIDKMPDLIKEKKLEKSNADVRNALFFTQADYLQALDLQNQLEALLVFLKGKSKELSMAYFGVKDAINMKSNTLGNTTINNSFGLQDWSK
jgi:hypothetical protein